MKDKELNKLLDEAEEGNRPVLKKLVEYYKSIDDEDNAVYYQSKLDEMGEDQEEKRANDDEFDYQKELVTYNRGEYNDLDISTLKTNKDKNPFYCLVLAKKYLASNQYMEAINCYRNGLAILNGCKNKDQNILFMVYYEAVRIMSNTPSNQVSLSHAEEYFKYISNALEIEATSANVNGYKIDLYKKLADCYRNGMGCEQNSEKAKEYSLKADAFTIEGCLNQSLFCYNQGLKVDEMEWLEKAKFILDSNKDQSLEGNSQYYKRLLLLKLDLKKKNGFVFFDNYKELFNTDNYKNYLTDDEMAKIDTYKCLYKICNCIKINDLESANNYLNYLPYTLDFNRIDIKVSKFLKAIIDNDYAKYELAIEVLNNDDNYSDVKSIAEKIRYELMKNDYEVSNKNKMVLFSFAVNNINDRVCLNYVEKACCSPFAEKISDNDLEQIVKTIYEIDHYNFEKWINDSSKFDNRFVGIYNEIKDEEQRLIEEQKRLEEEKRRREEEEKQRLIEEQRIIEEERRKKAEEEERKAKLEARKKMMAVVVTVVAIILFYMLFIHDGVDKPKKLISKNTVGYTKEIVTNYGDEVKNAITFENSNSVTFDFKKRYTTIAAVVGVRKDQDTTRYTTVRFDGRYDSLELSPFDKYEIVTFSVKDKKSFTFYSDSEDIYLAEVYLLDSDKDVESYTKRIKEQYEYRVKKEMSLSDACVMYSSEGNYSINKNDIVMDGTTSDAELMFNAYENYNSINGKVIFNDASHPATITVTADGETIYAKTFDKAGTRDFSISINKPGRIYIKVTNGELVLKDMLYSTKESTTNTVNLQNLPIVDSNNCEIVETIVSSLGNTYSNVITIGDEYDNDGYAKFKLGNKYSTLTIRAIMASDRDYAVLRINGDNNESLDRVLLHKTDDMGYEATLNVKNVDLLQIENANGRLIISEAILSSDDSLLDECKDRNGRVALYDMSGIDESGRIRNEYKVTKMGSEIFDYIGDDNFLNSYSGWNLTVYPNEQFTKFYGDLYSDASNSFEGEFRVYKDDELIYSETINSMDDVRRFDIDISGSKFIKLEYFRKEGGNIAYSVVPVYLSNAYME